MRRLVLLLAVLAPIPALAQSGFKLNYLLGDGNVYALSAGSTITFLPVDIGGTSNATIQLVNGGTDNGVLTGIQVAGTGFRVSGSPVLPANVGPGQSFSFAIVFAPTHVGAYNGTFQIELSGVSISGALSGATPPANLSFAYIDPDTNNVLPLSQGGTVPFPSTLTGTSSTVTLVVSNSGPGTGLVDSATVNAGTPSPFQLVNLPVLPGTVPPNQQLRFGLRFSPLGRQAYSGTLVVSLGGHPTTVNISAVGIGPQFTYVYGAAPTAVASGGTLALGDTTVGQTTSVAIVVSNAGNADGQIAGIVVTGSGLTLSDLPPFPFTVHGGGALTFTLNFAPAQPGTVNGHLTVGNDIFAVTANAVGPRLLFSYGTSVPVADGGEVIFPPVAVGNNAKMQFTIQNNGTSSAAIVSIYLTAASTPFTLEQLPPLPFNLDPGATATFGLSFTPGTTGGLNATLRINTSSFTLSGNGTQPAALPSYQFQSPPAGTLSGQQPSIGLMLAAPYPMAITGTFKLSFVSSVFTDDQAIQFATGGRSANFSIPANSTQALFNGNSSIPLQTGTTAGSIVITPSFAMPSGFDITPASPTALTITVPRAAPQLLGASITSETTTGFTLVLTGYSNTRALSKLSVQFSPKQGENFSGTQLAIDVSSTSASWYQSALAQTTGGSFLASIPFVLQNGGSSADLVHQLQSLSITATNDAGISTPVTVTIP